jgi:hypothetical protein
MGTAEREAGRTWDITEVTPEGKVQVREILSHGEPEVLGCGALVIREPRTGAVARIWAPGTWLAADREFITYGGRGPGGKLYEDEDDPGNVPRGRAVDR